MASASNFTDFIQARDAAGLQVFMSDERHLPADHIERNNRALFESCRDGVDEICEVLISFGTDVNCDVDHATPLFIACRNAHPACVDLLLAHGVNLNVCGLRKGRSSLMATAFEYNPTVGLTLDQFIDNRCRCMRSLLAAGAAIDQTENDGFTTLMWASWNFQFTEMLIKAGANVNILNNEEVSALHFGTQDNNIDVVELLLDGGADIDAIDGLGMTPLCHACTNLYPAVVDSLLRRNADIDFVDKFGLTALQEAMSRPATFPNRVAVLQLMATCAQTRLEASSADWIRLAQNKRN